ncbi:MAG: CD225/dispanin family protein [Muribaculaceae bacterium]|nr:CD225/dispanin family protein [Muribaculaceae bacterium]
MATKYYAMIDGEQRGPFTLEELPRAGVRPSTYIWCKGLPDWQKAEDNADVCRLFRNHLYDIMHPSSAPVVMTPEELDKYKVKPNDPAGPPPTRFDKFLQEAGESPLPTLDEITSQQDTTTPPVSMIGYAWLVTIFCFFPTGIVALNYAYKSKKHWKNGKNELSHEYSRKAKMWTGVTFFIGVIAYGLFMALSL